MNTLFIALLAYLVAFVNAVHTNDWRYPGSNFKVGPGGGATLMGTPNVGAFTNGRAVILPNAAHGGRHGMLGGPTMLDGLGPRFGNRAGTILPGAIGQERVGFDFGQANRW